MAKPVLILIDAELKLSIAVMDGVRDLIAATPGLVLLNAATALVASLAFQALGYLAFAALGRRHAAEVALVAGNRNMGVVIANLGRAATPELTLFFAAVQLPIYLLPLILRPLYRRLGSAATSSPVAEKPGAPAA